MSKGLTPPVPDLVALKLASLAVHCEELLSPSGHDFDREAIRGLLQDAEVQAWLKAVDPVFLPVKR